MVWNRTPDEIAADWQTEIETKLEAGTTPLLVTGTPALALHGAATLLAYQDLIARRNDITTPLLVAGGSSPLWTALLLAPGERPATPLPAVVFGGPDPSIYLASVETLSTGRLTAPSPVRSGTPPALAGYFAPRLAPGATAAWESLPFVEAGERPHPSVAGPAANDDPLHAWIAWGALLLALCLVLSALLI